MRLEGEGSGQEEHLTERQREQNESINLPLLRKKAGC